MNYRDHITVEPNKRGGKPCVRGLRITVYEVLLSLMQKLLPKDHKLLSLVQKVLHRRSHQLPLMQKLLPRDHKLLLLMPKVLPALQ